MARKRTVKKDPDEVLYIYTDGGCSGNPGVGGWAWVLTDGENIVKQGSGGSPQTTNNAMELHAVLDALKVNGRRYKYIIISDSQYVIDTISKWRFKWQQQGWRKKGGPIKNLPVIKEICNLIDTGAVIIEKWQWVQGHSGDRFNEVADRLAAEQIYMQKDSATQEVTQETTQEDTIPNHQEVSNDPRLDELEKRVAYLESKQYLYS